MGNISDLDLLFNTHAQIEEFITAVTTNGIVSSNRAFKSLRDHAQRPISGMMPMCIVDLFEIIQIDEHDRQIQTITFGVCQSLLQAVIE